MEEKDKYFGLAKLKNEGEPLVFDNGVSLNSKPHPYAKVRDLEIKTEEDSLALFIIRSLTEYKWPDCIYPEQYIELSTFDMFDCLRSILKDYNSISENILEDVEIEIRE